jgi:lysophospholipase L1-like esterase
MQKIKRLAGTLLICCLLQNFSFAQHNFLTVKRIVFLGNSITWAGMYVNNVEAFLRVQYPDRQFEIINAGLPSETVAGLSEPGHADGKFPRPDLHERLARVLEQTKPDLVFACYGMNDGIYMPPDTGRFQKFKEGINWLHKEVAQTGARIIHLTPPDYDEVKGGSTGYTNVLDQYADWLLAKKRSSKWEVIDIHYPMKKYLTEHRMADSAFALAPDGIHPGEAGHWIIARQILLYWGFKSATKFGGITESLQQVKDAGALMKLITNRQQMLRDAWLTATKHLRPGLPAGLPLKQAQLRADEWMILIKKMIRYK